MTVEHWHYWTDKSDVDYEIIHVEVHASRGVAEARRNYITLSRWFVENRGKGFRTRVLAREIRAFGARVVVWAVVVRAPKVVMYTPEDLELLEAATHSDSPVP